jgi:hypothetical protein
MDIYYIFVVILAVIFLVLLVVEHTIIPKRNKRTITKNFELLAKGVNHNNLDEEKIKLIHDQCKDGLFSIFYIIQYPFELFIKEFMLYIMEKDEDGSLTNEVDNILKPLLEKIREENLYSNVNVREQKILLSIAKTIKDSPNLADSVKTSIKLSLNNLAFAIEENQNALSKSQKTNKWAVPATYIGTIATIGFGIFGLIYN